MSLSPQEAKQRLEKLIFEEQSPQDWVEDVWCLSALHGNSAAKLVDAVYALIDVCPVENLANLLADLESMD
jgi:hypothetical protein